MTRFLLIRHALTDSVNKRLSGRKEGISLNAEGKLQAKNLADRLTAVSLNAVYSSPLQRATETARAIADVQQLSVKTMDDLVEIDFGEWTDHSIEELQKNRQFQLFNTFRSSTRIPSGELMIEAQARIVGALQHLASIHPNELIAVVSHGDLIKAAIAHFAGIHLDHLQRLEISPASVSILDLYPESARLLCLNHSGSLIP